MDQKISVAGLQLPQAVGDRGANLSNAIDAICSHPGHDVYVLPELSSSGYGAETFGDLERLAEDVEGPSFAAFSEVAKRQNCFICYSFPRRGENGKFHISASVVDRAGKLAAHYDKWHVCSTGVCCEKDFFVDGNMPLEVFEVDGIRVGIVICYDIRFPEIARKLTVEKNISLLLHPGGWPKDEGMLTWHTFLKVRAQENSIYIMSTNWAGPNNGSTAFCPPAIDGDRLELTKLGDEPGALVGVVDLRKLEEIRRQFPYLLDRNVDMYGSW